MELDTKDGDVDSEDRKEEKSDNPDKKDDQSSEEGQMKETTSTDVLALPKVRKRADEKGINLGELDIDGRIRMEDLKEISGRDAEDATKERAEHEESREDSETISTPQDIKASPSVRKLAREKEVNISNIEGSGRGGKITRDDLLNYSEKEDAETSSSVKESSGEDGEASGEELSGLEENVARKMTQSRFSAPHVTHVEKVDVTELVELREKANEEVDPHLTYMPFIMKASMLAMEDYPRTNAHFDGENLEIDTKDDYDFNIAVDTDRGLLVPRLDDVGKKNLLELATELSDIVEKTQNGDLSREDMRPGSFSITNLGAIGGEEFTPIINPPQTCILGVGKIQETAEVIEGDVVPRMTIKLSFSYDHRVIDGATAARFVNNIKENLENPEEMMVSL